ncbi:MAG: 4Fe-4S binding protein [Spirochaetia bacterium]
MPKAIKVGVVGGKVFGRIIDILKERPRIDLSKCTDCGTCVESCTMGAIDRPTKSIDYAKCIECLCCHELCMQKAVELRHTNRFMALVTGLFLHAR